MAISTIKRISGTAVVLAIVLGQLFQAGCANSPAKTNSKRTPLAKANLLSIFAIQDSAIFNLSNQLRSLVMFQTRSWRALELEPLLRDPLIPLPEAPGGAPAYAEDPLANERSLSNEELRQIIQKQAILITALKARIAELQREESKKRPPAKPR